MPMLGEVKNAVGPKGKGTLHKTSDGLKVKAETGDVYPIARESIPEYLNPIYDKPVFFRLSPDETELRGIGPWEGSFLLRFDQFAPKSEDGLAEPRLKKGGPFTYTDKNGRKRKAFAKDKLTFTAMSEVVGGDYDGLRVAWFLDYIFVPREGNETGWVGSARSVADLETFLKAAGCDFSVDSVAWNTENVLPNLERFLVERDAIYQGVVEEGRLKSLHPLPPGMKPDNIRPRDSEQEE